MSFKSELKSASNVASDGYLVSSMEPELQVNPLNSSNGSKSWA